MYVWGKKQFKMRKVKLGRIIPFTTFHPSRVQVEVKTDMGQSLN